MWRNMVASGVVLAIALVVGCAAQERARTQQQGSVELKTAKDKVSYCIGISIGSNMRADGIEVDAVAVARGIADGLAGSPAMTSEEMDKTMVAFEQEIMAKRQAQQAALAEKNKKEGDEFLAANAKKEGVKVLPSGLQYKVLTEGSGKMPKPEETVGVNYRGTLVDGTEFDSSAAYRRPSSFKVGEDVIVALREALPMMKVGSKWQLFIPPNLAYGEQGGGPIGPNAVVIFEIELLSIEEAPAKPAPDSRVEK